MLCWFRLEAIQKPSGPDHGHSMIRALIGLGQRDSKCTQVAIISKL